MACRDIAPFGRAVPSPNPDHEAVAGRRAASRAGVPSNQPQPTLLRLASGERPCPLLRRSLPHPCLRMPSTPDLRETVDRAAAELRAIPEAVASVRPAPGKWSIKEIIGHLIDSASHNHQRFVRARWQDDLMFQGYQQDEWVAAQQYQSVPWDELVTLWQTYNRHVARVMAQVPTAIARREHRRHNLDQIAWQTVPADQPATLEYFMRDYVAHLKHHLRQVGERRSTRV